MRGWWLRETQINRRHELVYRLQRATVGRTLVSAHARMVELVDTRDLKSLGHYGRAGSSPALRTKIINNNPAKCAGLLFGED